MVNKLASASSRHACVCRKARSRYCMCVCVCVCVSLTDNNSWLMIRGLRRHNSLTVLRPRVMTSGRALCTHTHRHTHTWDGVAGAQQRYSTSYVDQLSVCAYVLACAAMYAPVCVCVCVSMCVCVCVTHLSCTNWSTSCLSTGLSTSGGTSSCAAPTKAVSTSVTSRT